MEKINYSISEVTRFNNVLGCILLTQASSSKTHGICRLWVNVYYIFIFTDFPVNDGVGLKALEHCRVPLLKSVDSWFTWQLSLVYQTSSLLAHG